MKVLRIELPDELLSAVGEDKAQALAREALLVRLYELGEVSTGRAAEILGVSRREFLDLLGAYGVSEFDDTIDLLGEASRG
jgi:predicted HTH domain antitoxin